MTSKLDYIKDLGVGVISLSPSYEDDGSDGDFHLMNHMKIDDAVGGDQALNRLITQAHEKGKRLILFTKSISCLCYLQLSFAIRIRPGLDSRSLRRIIPNAFNLLGIVTVPSPSAKSRV